MNNNKNKLKNEIIFIFYWYPKIRVIFDYFNNKFTNTTCFHRRYDLAVPF